MLRVDLGSCLVSSISIRSPTPRSICMDFDTCPSHSESQVSSLQCGANVSRSWAPYMDRGLPAIRHHEDAVNENTPCLRSILCPGSDSTTAICDLNSCSFLPPPPPPGLHVGGLRSFGVVLHRQGAFELRT